MLNYGIISRFMKVIIPTTTLKNLSLDFIQFVQIEIKP